MPDLSAPMTSSLGVGSNLDLGTLLNDLRGAEQRRLQPLQASKASHQSRLSAYGTLNDAVQGLRSAANRLNDPALYESVKAGVAGDGIKVATGAGAVPGSYQVSVSQLAQSQSLASAALADAGAPLGAGGTLTIAVGSEPAVSIDLTAADSTLAGIRDAINRSGAGVSATIVNDGSDTPYHLVLTSGTSGTAGRISLTVQDAPAADGTPLADLLGSGQLTEVVPAQDAQLQVNGIAVTRGSNTVEDAVEGLTLYLTDAVDDARITVSRDDAAVTKAIESFVSSYNGYRGTLAKLTAFNGADAANGVLLGDAAARTVASQLSSALNTPAAGASLSTLRDIGISLQAGGTLKIDNARLSEAIASSPQDVARLFAGDAGGAGSGIAGELLAAIDRLAGDNGLLASASDGVQSRIDQLDVRMQGMQERIDATVERYRRQFVRLDAVMADLNSVGAYLTSQFAQLEQMRNAS